jgi:hypothetical protein
MHALRAAPALPSANAVKRLVTVILDRSGRTANPESGVRSLRTPDGTPGSGGAAVSAVSSRSDMSDVALARDGRTETSCPTTGMLADG